MIDFHFIFFKILAFINQSKKLKVPSFIYCDISTVKNVWSIDVEEIACFVDLSKVVHLAVRNDGKI